MFAFACCSVSQLQETVPLALSRLRAVGLQFTRPCDYLAEMLKSDEVMGRVRSRIRVEQEKQRQFEVGKNQRFNKKFNKLSGHQLVRQQEECRKRNLQLKAIAQWASDRRKAVREGSAVQEAEADFDQWLLGNEKEEGNCSGSAPKPGLNSRKAKGHRPHRRKGRNNKAKARPPKGRKRR